jgi:hypothetical protein
VINVKFIVIASIENIFETNMDYSVTFMFFGYLNSNIIDLDCGK